MSCKDCLIRMEAILKGIPEEWRKQIAMALCEAQGDPGAVDESTVKANETHTYFSQFTLTGNNLCISYTNEAGVTVNRCVDITSVFNTVLNQVDPLCVIPQGDWTASDLQNKVQALVDKQCDCCNPVTTTTTTAAPTTTTTTTTEFVTVYWGWTPTYGVLSPSDIVTTAQGSDTIIPGSNITADYTANTQPMYLWMAEPLTEPLKTKWDGDAGGNLNQGNIGGSMGGNLFESPASSGSFRFYITGWLTQNTDYPIEFKVI